ncbi:MBL fold metallo-hydrolase [Alphaproteobacteria bacterium GH1-50]|uniref:MBL fold metallo-hydrolase n=1 Tax=Kangsaoukella pontilimi TaxID=2691042 RepID=A0A7C9MVA7_9RHOB|nr:MBL fold metallo-hydrolase [Kangsaoukella pontilimi]MXQ07520.1 MBL fold metallo-hydrolase [Kangsaoukella pontilimi]
MTDAVPGTPVEIDDGVRLLLAPNAGPMTHRGTNTWLVGETDLAVIDPGPDDPAHFDALLSAAGGRAVTHILVTHAHADHSALAPRLAQATGAEIIGFGPATTGRSAVMERLASEGGLAGGEGLDARFTPHRAVRDGDRITGKDWTLDVLHTPGHFAGHLSFQLDEALFSGDHLMDWSTTIVSPPDGDIAAFLETSRRLIGLAPARCLTGHGGVIHDPAGRLSELIAHREAREAQILDAIGSGADTVAKITARLYADVAPLLLAAAERNVLAHLIDLESRMLIRATPAVALRSSFELV